MKSTQFKIVYILPSRYDDEGYVHRYWRGVQPSNTLCCLKSLTCDLASTGALGRDLGVSVEIYDDSVQRIPVRRIVRRSRRRGERLLVGFVGVQSNQFPRAADLALQFRAADVPVMIGGFHVSGVLGLSDGPSPELQHLLDHGVTLVRGEVEGPGVLAGILRDALDGAMKPIYDIAHAPDITEAVIPQPDKEYLSRFLFKNTGTIDTSRGCPFDCSFCTIINVQGRKMRYRSPARMLKSIEENYARSVNFYFFTDDNIARNPVWEELFDGLIRFRERGMDIRFMMQVDAPAWRIPRFVEKAAAAGCYLVFIGLETINPENVLATGKRQNKVHQFVEMVETWRRARVLVYGAYIIGLPHDTPESVRRELAILRDRIKVDEVSFFMLTPLPGSRDHLEMVRKRVPLDADLNNYDSFHETFRHPNIAPGEWQGLYREAWNMFYFKEHMVDVLLRTPPERYWKMFWLFLWNRYSMLLRTHPMITGFIRLKDRKGRRPAFPRESVPRYAWRRAKDMLQQARVIAHLFFEFQEIWLLTRKREDPRWAALADLRAKWVEVRQRLSESGSAGRCGDAARELRAMLRTASKRMYQLSASGRASNSSRPPGGIGRNRRLRRKLHRKAREIEKYLRAFERQVPSWKHIVQAERFVKENLLAGYEELAIRYVAKRRRFNVYRRNVLRRFRTGRILTLNVSAMPRVVFFEFLLALRFGLGCLRHL